MNAVCVVFFYAGKYKIDKGRIRAYNKDERFRINILKQKEFFREQAGTYKEGKDEKILFDGSSRYHDD